MCKIQQGINIAASFTPSSTISHTNMSMVSFGNHSKRDHSNYSIGLEYKIPRAYNDYVEPQLQGVFDWNPVINYSPPDLRCKEGYKHLQHSQPQPHKQFQLLPTNDYKDRTQGHDDRGYQAPLTMSQDPVLGIHYNHGNWKCKNCFNWLIASHNNCLSCQLEAVSNQRPYFPCTPSSHHGAGHTNHQW